MAEAGVEDVAPVADELGGEQGDGFQTVQAQTTSPRQLTASAGVLVTQRSMAPASFRAVARMNCSRRGVSRGTRRAGVSEARISLTVL